MSRQRILLSFSQIECLRCHGARIRGIPCSTCGLLPDEREVDPKKQARQRAAEQAAEILRTPKAGSDETEAAFDFGDVWKELDSWVDTYMEALADAAKGEPQPLLASIRSLKRITHDCERNPRRRPWLGIWDAQATVLDHLRRLVESHLAALGANTPIEAQRLSSAAQEALDDASRALNQFSEEMERYDEVQEAESPEAASMILAQQVFSKSGATDVLTLDAAGAGLYERVIQRQENPPTGYGLILQLTIAQVEALVDRERLIDVARQAFTRLETAPRFLGVLQDDTWFSDFADTLTALHDAGTVYGGAMVAARNNRQAARSVLDFTHVLVERVAKRYIATLLMDPLGRSYSAMRRRDAGGLLNTAAQHKFGDMLQGIDRALRIAKAHEEFQVNEENLTVTRTGQPEQTLTLDDLLDRSLLGLESAIGIQLGIICAAAANGVDSGRLFSEELATLQEFDEQDRVKIVLSLSGWSEIEITVDDELMVVKGQAAQVPKALPMVAAVIPHISNEIRELQFEWTDRDGAHHELAGPAVPFRSWATASGELDEQCFSLEAQATWTLSGVPTISSDEVRKFAAIMTGRAITKPLPDAVADIRRLLVTAEELEDTELVGALKACLAAKRSEISRLPLRHDEHEGLRWIAHWEQRKIRPE